MKPIRDRAFIEFDIDPDAPITEIGGIITPEGYRRPHEGNAYPYYEATVRTVGPDCKSLKVGDRIAVRRDSVEKFGLGPHTYWQINESACAGILS